MIGRAEGLLRVSVSAIEKKKGDSSDIFFLQGELGSLRVPQTSTDSVQELVELPAHSSLFSCSQLNFAPFFFPQRANDPSTASATTTTSSSSTSAPRPAALDLLSSSITSSSSSSSNPPPPILILHVYRAASHQDTPRKIGLVQFPLDSLPSVHRTIPFGPTYTQAWKPVGNKKHNKGELRFSLRFTEFRSLFSLRGAWDSLSAGGCLDYPTWTECPQYSMVLDASCLVSVFLHAVKDAEQEVQGASVTLVCYVLYMGAYSSESSGVEAPSRRARTRPIDHEDIRKTVVSHVTITSKKGTSDPIIRSDIDLEAGQYVLLPCTSVPRVFADFSLSVSAPTSVHCTLQPISKHSVGGDGFDDFDDDDHTISRRCGILPPWLHTVPNSSQLHSPEAELEALTQKLAVCNNDGRLCHSILDAIRDQNQAEVRRFVELGAVDERDIDGNSALALAIHVNNVEIIRMLLGSAKVAPQLDLCDHKGLTPLMKCAILNRPKCSKLLINAGVNALLEDKRKETASFKAAVLGRIETSRQLISSTDRRVRGAARNLFMSPNQAREDWTAVKLGLIKPPQSSFYLHHDKEPIKPFFDPLRVLNVFEAITETDTKEHLSFFQILSLNNEIMSAVLLFSMKRGETPDPHVVEATAEGHIEILRVLAKRGDLPPAYLSISKLASVTPLFYDVVPTTEFQMIMQQRQMRRDRETTTAEQVVDPEYRDMKDCSQIYLPLLVHSQKMSFLLDSAEAVSYIRISCDSLSSITKDCSFLQIRSVGYQDRTLFFEHKDFEVSARGAKARKKLQK